MKDLCGRLPYGVKVQSYNYEEDIETIETLYEINSDGYTSTIECDTLKNIHKPYLFPLSSMTEEQKQYLKNRFCYDWNNEPYDLWICQIEIGDVDELIDWFYKNHIDYRNLIDENLAIDATGLNIY